MRYFDCHLHLHNATAEGFERMLHYLASEKHRMLGGLLLLNTPEEVAVFQARRKELPPSIDVVPYLPLRNMPEIPVPLAQLGWRKVHPSLHGITLQRFPEVFEAIQKLKPEGIMIHHFPWGPSLETSTSLPLILEIAHRFPSIALVATHGGGYESWQLRAHTAPLPNIYYDFSATLSYYAGTDYLIPFRQYLEKRRNRLVFGTDWPSASFEPQWIEAARLANEVSITETELEDLLLANSRSLWPRARAWTGV